MYNKVDMTCFIVEARASSAKNLTEGLAATPLTPEMKLAADITADVAFSDPMISRAEAMFCTEKSQEASEDLADAFLEQLRDNDARKLHLESFLDHGISKRDARRHAFWHRSLEGASSSLCDNLFSSLQVDTSPSTIIFTLRPEFYQDNNRSCVQALLIHLASQKEVCFVGGYQPIQTTNTVAAGVVQSGKQDSTPFFFEGLDGRGQVVAVSDTGVDVDNCYFWDRSAAAQRDRSGRINRNARKVVQYFAFSDSTDVERGHGSKFESSA